METIQGKTTRTLGADELLRRLAGYHDVLVDLGTGDGHFVLQAARQDPALFAIGVDACRENLRRTTLHAPGNVLFVIANALALPPALHGLAGRVTVNFPWGSLLLGLLQGDPSLLAGLRALGHPGARLEVRLNASALAEAGWSLADGGQRVRQVLADAGFRLRPPQSLGPTELRGLPTTWARRMAYGKCPQAVGLWAALPAAPQPGGQHG